MNTKFTTAMAGLAMAVTMFSTGGAAAYTNQFQVSITGLSQQHAAITPLSMQYFCAAHRSECAGGGGTGQVTMSPDLMGVLTQINSRVNRAIRPKAETAGVDRWQLNPTSGDCEDYVLSKRSALIRKGLPAGSLRIAYTHTRSGAPHAVLVVKTSQGSYVLDNLNSSVKTLRGSGYNIRSMSSANPNQWVAG